MSRREPGTRQRQSWQAFLSPVPLYWNFMISLPFFWSWSHLQILDTKYSTTADYLVCSYLSVTCHFTSICFDFQLNCWMVRVLHTLRRSVIVKQFMVQPLGGIISQPLLDIAKNTIEEKLPTFVREVRVGFVLRLSFFVVLDLWCKMKGFSFTMFVLPLWNCEYTQVAIDPGTWRKY